jgi:hypothetical protein
VNLELEVNTWFWECGKRKIDPTIDHNLVITVEEVDCFIGEIVR